MSIDCSTVDASLQTLCTEATAALSGNVDTLNAYQADGDMFLLVWGSSLVLFMHAGFAMLSAGAVRTKSTKNILLSIVMDLTVCAVGWFFLGFGFAFGDDRGGFIGGTKFAGFGIPLEDYGFFLFQYCFAATAATIVSGAIAERARFETYLVTSAYMSIWVYPVVTHWVWGGGFLTSFTAESVMGFGALDFAGCGPVHMVGGVAGLVGSKIMGPRVGRYDPATGAVLPMPGHSASLATLGTFILWVGWLGFNCGSVLVLNGSGLIAARAGVMTVLSSATGALAAMTLAHFMSSEREFDLAMCLNGALGGLVSITGCCAFVEMWAALVIGMIGGFIMVLSSKFVLKVLKVDDPLDATAVHFFDGMWGIIAGGFFANPVHVDGTVGGVVYGSGAQLIGAGVTEIVCIIVWVCVFTIPFFMFFNKMGVLRITADMEEAGLDASSHGGPAYPEEVYPKKE